MRHLDPDDLALIALGEDIDGAAHLAECSACATEVASLRRVVLVGRSVTIDDVPTSPPPAVWERVQAELGLADTSAQSRPRLPRPAPVRPAPPAGGAEDASRAGTVVRQFPARRPRVAGWIAGAAAAGVLVGALGGAWWASRPGADDSQGTVLAEATLDPLPGWEAAGTAVVRQEVDGSRVVVVDIDASLGDDGFREVWLLAPDVSGMVSLGLLDGSSGEFVLPAGVDLERYPVVDVSEEPLDGDASHSGNSIVRGVLGA